MVSGWAAQRKAFPERRCKLVVGSAGGCGTDNQVDLLVLEVRQLGINKEAIAGV